MVRSAVVGNLATGCYVIDLGIVPSRRQIS
jgi:hypothetical protein